MSREIKFRGLTEYGTWVFGGVYDNHIIQDTKDVNLTCVLLVDRIRSVIPETISQYIGFTDKNKKEVYEGDIVRITWANGKIGGDYKVFYFKEGAFFQLENIKDENDLDTFCGYSTEQIEVIGNIYQNLDSLKIK